jgi:hypothetical protein
MPPQAESAKRQSNANFRKWGVLRIPTTFRYSLQRQRSAGPLAPGANREWRLTFRGIAAFSRFGCWPSYLCVEREGG